MDRPLTPDERAVYEELYAKWRLRVAERWWPELREAIWSGVIEGSARAERERPRMKAWAAMFAGQEDECFLRAVTEG